MKYAAAAILGCALIASLSVVSAEPALARGIASAPCAARMTKIQGKTAFVYCGPATATLTTAGKTYTFRNGFCQRSATGGIVLQLGTKVIGSNTNAGKPYISFGRDTTSARIAGAFYGGKVLADFTDIKVSGNPLKTTFKGYRFTGSWNCHGHVYQ